MKVWNYVFISITMSLFLTLTGFATGFDSLITTLLSIDYSATSGLGSVAITVGSLFNYLFSSVDGVLMSLAGAGAVIVGLYTKSSAENIILGAFASAVLVNFVSTFVKVMNDAIALHQVWLSSLILIIFAPLTVGFVIALAEFLRGTD